MQAARELDTELASILTKAQVTLSNMMETCASGDDFQQSFEENLESMQKEILTQNPKTFAAARVCGLSQ